MTIRMIIATTLAASCAGGAVANAAGDPAVLHFADLNGGVRDWRPDTSGKTDAILVQGRNDQWYRATFWAACPEVNYVPRVAFVTDALGDLDRFTSIIADGHRCHFKTFEQTEAPNDQKQGSADVTTAAPR